MRILIIGGNRFFGKKLASRLSSDHDLYLLNRGNLDDEVNFSPYGINSDWFMSTNKLKNKGVDIPEVLEWLPDLVRELVDSCDLRGS